LTGNCNFVRSWSCEGCTDFRLIPPPWGLADALDGRGEGRRGVCRLVNGRTPPRSTESMLRGSQIGYTEPWSRFNSNSMPDSVGGRMPRAVRRSDGLARGTPVRLDNDSAEETFDPARKLRTMVTTSSAGADRSCSTSSTCSVNSLCEASRCRLRALAGVSSAVTETYVQVILRLEHLEHVGRRLSH
jgi:hypothetical protein